MRHEIVDRLTAMGPTNVRELAGALGRKVTTVYHHLNVLEEAGLIEAMSLEASERGRPFVVYKAVAPRVRLIRAALNPTLHKPMSKWARMVAVQAAREYSGGMRHSGAKNAGPGRNLWLFRLVATPSPGRLKRINQVLDELADLVWNPDPDPGQLLSIAFFISPLEREAHASRPGRRTKKRKP